MNFPHKKNRGFTLIEMLIVIAIVAVLTTIVIVSANSARKKARTAQSLNDLGMLQLALANYQGDNNGRYPSSQGGAGPWDGLYTSFGDSSTTWIAGLSPKYIRVLPRSPYNTTDGGLNYIYNSDGVNYKLIWHGPEDCVGVKKTHPELIDPMRDCYAYGYWTPNAATW